VQNHPRVVTKAIYLVPVDKTGGPGMAYLPRLEGANHRFEILRGLGSSEEGRNKLEVGNDLDAWLLMLSIPEYFSYGLRRG